MTPEWAVDITVFYDDIDTLFEKGPWLIDGKEYDYKLTEYIDGSLSVDYCSISQMIAWGVTLNKVVK